MSIKLNKFVIIKLFKWVVSVFESVIYTDPQPHPDPQKSFEKGDHRDPQPLEKLKFLLLAISLNSLEIVRFQ